MVKVEVTDIEWDAPKSVKGDLPKSFVFHLDTEDEGIDCSDEVEIHEWVSDKSSAKRAEDSIIPSNFKTS